MKYIAIGFVLLLSGCVFSVGGGGHSKEEKAVVSECGCAEDMLRLSNAMGMKGPDERRTLAESYKLCIENCRARCQQSYQNRMQPVKP